MFTKKFNLGMNQSDIGTGNQQPRKIEAPYEYLTPVAQLSTRSTVQ
jgi:hypothetical protein